MPGVPPVSFKTDNADARKVLENALFRYKLAMEAAQQKFGGTVRYASQHSVLWGAMGQSGFSTADWLGVCAGLSIEWLKAEAAGKDFLSELLTTRNAVFKRSPGTNADVTAFSKRVSASHLGQGDVAKALKGVMAPDGDAASVDFPFVTLSSAFRRGDFGYISSGTHAMAAKVGTSFFANTIDFYDPNVGELRGTKIGAIGPYLKACKEATQQAQGNAASAADGKMSVRNFRKV